MTVPDVAGAAAGAGTQGEDGAPTPIPATSPEGHEQPPKGDDDGLGEKGKAAIAAERQARREAERRAKEGDAAIARLKEIEDAQKSEQQKLTERAEKAEREAAEAQASLLRRDVAADKQLPPAMADRLRGTTREELEADADQLLQLLSKADPKPEPDAGDQGKKGAPAPQGGGGQAPAKDMTDAVSRHYAGRH